MKYKVKTFDPANIIGREMEVFLNVAAGQGWQLFQTTAIGSHLVIILQREDNE